MQFRKIFSYFYDENCKTQRRVAIFGSCVSRDNFNSKFNENYKDRYRVTLLQNQSSIVSAVADPLTGIETKIEGKGGWSRATILDDCNKSFFAKYNSENVIIMDNFADVRFGYTEVLGTRLTHNTWHIGATEFESYFHNSKDMTPTEDLENYAMIYRVALHEFVKRIKDINPNVVFVLNSARAAADEWGEEGLTKNKYKLQYFNTAWDALDDIFLDVVPDCIRIKVDPSKIVGWDKHPWGSGYVHYILDFYAEFLSNLSKALAQRKVPIN